MRVTFLGVGAQKCASSWIHEVLSDHPEVIVPARKELDFFSYHFENGLDWYERQFPNRVGARAVGEISPSYLHEPGVPERVRSHVGSVKIVVSLRDPVERALSHHRHLVRLGMVRDDDLSFESALARNPSYVEQGLYYRHLSRWVDIFGRSGMHIVLTEDIRIDRQGVTRRLYEFLQVDPTHRSKALNANSNVSYVPRHRGLERSVAAIRGGLSAVGAGHVWTALGDVGLRRLYRAGNRRRPSDVIPEPRQETLKSLRATFASDIQKLSDLIERDLQQWR
ncbi:MAG TPA: sulfotransferase domain-containing protein [Accumulibacter sp.]|nr:sulfotransferase domain-containing protein [Accumulibacter sp.]